MISLFHNIAAIVAVKRDPVAYARSLGVKVGADVRLISIRPGFGTFGSEPYLISIGDHVTITGGVQFVTHDGGVWVFRDKEPNLDVYGLIIIGNNVFVGYGAIIMPGVQIGDNVVIGAGAVVTRDIPSNTVAVGSPAKSIMTIDQYYESIQLKKDNVRNLSVKEKRSYLLKKFDV